MALFKSHILSAISGRLGSAEFASGKRSAVIRKAKLRGNAQSANFINASNVHTQHLKLFSALSVDQRLSWASLAQQLPRPNRLGTETLPTASQAFLAHYLGFHDYFETGQWFVPQVTDYPWTATPRNPRTEQVAVLSATFNGLDSCSLTFSGNWLGAYAQYLFLYYARFQPSWARGKPRSFKRLCSIHVQSGTYDFFDLFAAANVQFVFGERYAIGLRAWANGSSPSLATWFYGIVS